MINSQKVIVWGCDLVGPKKLGLLLKKGVLKKGVLKKVLLNFYPILMSIFLFLST